jgi:Ca-activated chloride channel family protein
VYRLEYSWLLALLPLPFLVYWLLPPYKEEQDSLRLTFFNYITSALGVTPQPGAVIPKTNWLQKILAPICCACSRLLLRGHSLLNRRSGRSSPGAT